MHVHINTERALRINTYRQLLPPRSGKEEGGLVGSLVVVMLLRGLGEYWQKRDLSGLNDRFFIDVYDRSLV